MLFFSSGLTIPAEIIVLKASSTEISKSLTEASGTNVYQPVVGLGAVGIKHLTTFLPILSVEKVQHYRLRNQRCKVLRVILN